MVEFDNDDNDYSFSYNQQEVAIGQYTEEGFSLVFNDDVLVFANAMQAFSHLRRELEPKRILSQQTIDLFTKPAIVGDSMRKYSAHMSLKGVESVCTTDY